MGKDSISIYDQIVKQWTKDLVLVLAALVSTVPASAWRLNYDWWTTAQVAENTTDRKSVV